MEKYPGFVLTISGLHLACSLLSTTGNVMVIQALRKASSIPSNLKVLFSSLAIADLATGLLPQPMLGIIFMVMTTTSEKGSNGFDIFCPTMLNIGYFSFVFLASASFLTVTIISVDRLLAVSLHLRYQELVTFKRVVVVLVSIWMASIVAATIFVTLPRHNNIAPAIIEIVGLIFTSVACGRIYKAVKYHQNQIQSQLDLPNIQAEKLLREKKSAFSAMFVYIVLVACYLPNLCCEMFWLTSWGGTTILMAEHVSFFLVLLNSVLNPVIYCWRYREIRVIMNNRVNNVFRKLYGPPN